LCVNGVFDKAIPMKRYFPRLHRHLAARFEPDSLFGLHLTVGVVLLCLAAWLFGEIAGEVVDKASLTIVDQQVATWFHQYAASAWTPFFLVITHWHGQVGMVIMASMLAGYLYSRQAYYWLASLVLAVPGGMLLNVLLKYFYQRARPSFDDPIVSLASFSFPSGHTSGSTLFYGVLGAYLVCLSPRWGVRAAWTLLAVGMVALVGLSRIYLGAHFLSDVLGAAAASGAWLAICITGVSTLRRRHAILKTE
jgi:membrane-associated phospholipid phosphatase